MVILQKLRKEVREGIDLGMITLRFSMTNGEIEIPSNDDIIR